jgi:mRNA-degrading endonuclease YafQ of YafQ-DinJ toxin-antitoxin module
MSVQSKTGTWVEVSPRALKSLRRCPREIQISFLTWKGQIEMSGLIRVQSIPGYRDEALQGKLRGIRSSRLCPGYRVYYRTVKTSVLIVKVEEVNLHDYKKIERLFGG